MTTYATAPSAPLPVQLTAEDRLESLPADTFRSAFRMHPSGVAVVTADVAGQPVAITVSSLASVSAEPPLIVFSVSARASSSAVMQEADSVVVHLVGTDQLWLVQLGATSGVDRFEDRSTWNRLSTGEPVFSAVPVWLRGTVVLRLEVGDASLFVIHAVAASVAEELADSGATPLVYHARTWHQLNDHSRLV